MDTTKQPEWREITDSAFNSHVGPIRFARVNETTWLAELVLTPKHMNKGGVCHGGVYMTLADVAMGAAAFEAGGNQPCATVDFDAHFLAAAKLGQVLLATARLNRLVSGICFMECELTAGGRTCLRASGIWKYLSKRKAG